MDALKSTDTNAIANRLGQELLDYLDKSMEIETQRLAKEVEKSQRYMNKANACKYCGITNNTLDKWLTRGLGRIHIDGVVRFDKEDLDKFMKAHKGLR